MNFFFDIKLEFEHSKLEKEIIKTSLKGKGYCCFVDLTSLVYSYNNNDFQEVLNGAIINSCDGSYIAMSVSKIYKERVKEYIGPDFFKKFIFKDGNHLVIGSTPLVFEKITKRVKREGGDISNLSYIELPFKNLNEFDYSAIAGEINLKRPNYIWVSLGAPKQEYFMSKLLPFIDGGIMLGVGAALNYFSGEIKDIPTWTKKIHVVWIYRLITEPKKQFKRLKTIFITFPKMIKKEKLRAKNS